MSARDGRTGRGWAASLGSGGFALVGVLAFACVPPAAVSSPTAAGLVRVKFDPPDLTGIQLDVRDERGRASAARFTAPTAGCVEASLPAPGTYAIGVSRGGLPLTTIGPLALLPGLTEVAYVQLAATQPVATPVRRVIGDFSAAAWPSWENSTYFPWSRKNAYSRARGPDGEAIAHVESDGAGSMLIRPVQADEKRTPIARWRWKVPGPIAGANERVNDTDDAAARVYFAWGLAGKADLSQAKALGYIWGRTRRVGEIGASPFSAQIGIVCLRSGAAGAGVWQDETRDILADYRAYFGRAPEGPLTAIAILTDTDNTKGHAKAWYGPITLEARPEPGPISGPVR